MSTMPMAAGTIKHAARRKAQEGRKHMNKNIIRKNKNVTFYLSGISIAAFMAIVAELTEQAYIVSVNDLHVYDEDTNLYSATFDLNITSRFHAFGHYTDWKRMREATATVYTMVKNDVMSRRYGCGSISFTFFRDYDDKMIHYYTVYTSDYKAGTSEGDVRYIRLR